MSKLIGVVSMRNSTFFHSLGVSHRVSSPHTHQKNGTAERKHHHIVETGLTLLAHASVPLCYWNDAFATTCFLISRLPSRTINMKTTLQRLLNETPDYTFFKVFGCACWPHLRPYNNHKLDFVRRSVCFWAIVLFTRDTNVSMFHLIVSIF
jgi:histone deacetylase 1/2